MLRILERLENGQAISGAQYDTTLRALSGRTTVRELLDDSSGNALPGSIWGAGGYLYREVAEPGLGTITTVGGIHLLVLPIGMVIHPEQFGAVADATRSSGNPRGTNNTPFLQAACDHAGTMGYAVQLSGGSYGMAEPLVVRLKVTFRGVNEEQTTLRKLTDTVLIENRASGSVFENFLMRGRAGSRPGPNDRDNSPAFIAYRRVNLANINAHRTGGPGWHGPQSGDNEGNRCFIYGFLADDSNVNLSRAINISASRCYGDIVYIQRLSGSTDINGQNIEVHKVNIFTGAVINARGGWRNHFRVYQAEGGRASSGSRADYSTVFRLNCSESRAEAIYTSGHQQYGAVLEGGNNIVTFQHNRAKTPWLLDDPRNTLIDAYGGFHFFGVNMRRKGGSPARFWGVQRVGVRRRHTSGGASYGSGEDMGYILLAPAFSGSPDTTQHHVQNAYGTLLCGSGANTSGNADQGRFATMQVSVRTQGNHTAATLHGESGEDFGLRLVTLSLMEGPEAGLEIETTERKRYLAVAVHPGHKRLFRHVHFAGFVTEPYQLIKVDDTMDRHRVDANGDPVYDEGWDEEDQKLNLVPRIEPVRVIFDVQNYRPTMPRFFGRPGDDLPASVDWANAFVDEDGFVRIRS
jgi:hypothetical protein